MRIKKFGADMEGSRRIPVPRREEPLGTRKTDGAYNNLRDCPVCQQKWT